MRRRGEALFIIILAVALLSWIGTQFQIRREETLMFTEKDAVR